MKIIISKHNNMKNNLPPVFLGCCRTVVVVVVEALSWLVAMVTIDCYA